MNKKFLFFVVAMFIVVIIFNVVINDNNENVSSIISVKDCNVQQKLCTIELTGFNVEISMDQNIYYLKKFNVDVWGESSIDIESVQINFKMKNMNMGNNNFLLNKIIAEDKKQHWKASAILPVCVSGRADWFSELEVIVNSNKYIIKFPIFIQK